MDEGREKAPVHVAHAILGPNHPPIEMTTFIVRNVVGEVVYMADNATDVRLFRGSRSEH